MCWLWLVNNFKIARYIPPLPSMFTLHCCTLYWTLLEFNLKFTCNWIRIIVCHGCGFSSDLRVSGCGTATNLEWQWCTGRMNAKNKIKKVRFQNIGFRTTYPKGQGRICKKKKTVSVVQAVLKRNNLLNLSYRKLSWRAMVAPSLVHSTHRNRCQGGFVWVTL